MHIHIKQLKTNNRTPIVRRHCPTMFYPSFWSQIFYVTYTYLKSVYYFELTKDKTLLRYMPLKDLKWFYRIIHLII